MVAMVVIGSLMISRMMVFQLILHLGQAIKALPAVILTPMSKMLLAPITMIRSLVRLIIFYQAEGGMTLSLAVAAAIH